MITCVLPKIGGNKNYSNYLNVMVNYHYHGESKVITVYALGRIHPKHWLMMDQIVPLCCCSTTTTSSAVWRRVHHNPELGDFCSTWYVQYFTGAYQRWFYWGRWGCLFLCDGFPPKIRPWRSVQCSTPLWADNQSHGSTLLWPLGLDKNIWYRGWKFPWCTSWISSGRIFQTETCAGTWRWGPYWAAPSR